jgi:SNF2 family DNA or RNA helicase
MLCARRLSLSGKLSVILRDKALFLETPTGEHPLTAMEIYSAIFGGGAVIEGVAVADSSFNDTGLTFSDSACSPVIIVTAEESPDGPRIFARLGGAAHGQHEIASGDYVILGSEWLPLPLGSADEIAQTLHPISVSLGEITIGEYLRLQKAQLDVPVIDRTGTLLSSSALSLSVAISPPPNLQAKFFPYQEAGFRWLAFMAKNGVGTILADEMGLGKTLQVIAVLLAETNEHRTPNLVVCPATIIENWRRECAKFAPGLSVHLHTGPRRTGRASILTQYDVVVCSYETMVTDVALLGDVQWNFVVLDEAQSIKNPEALRSTKIRLLPRRVSVAITGTPVENSLRDLWSITDFVTPGLLGSLGNFSRRFPDTQPGAAELEPYVSGLMLRRRVAEVATDLPERIDIPVPLAMDAKSASAYEEIRHEAAAKNPQSPDFAAMMPLRLFCAHPWLAERMHDQDAADCSPKLVRCHEILEEILTNGEKAIVFTSFQESADILSKTINTRFGVFTAVIDGRCPVKERQPLIDQFSATQGSAVLVLNPRAAGVGLNITAANHVIHYNLEWNPAIEDQASARSHRRGQTRPVTVHRLFYTDTVEEVADERMSRKRALSSAAVVGTDGTTVEFDDIRKAFTISPIHQE